MDRYNRNGIKILGSNKSKHRKPIYVKSLSLADAEKRMCLDKKSFSTELVAKSHNKGQRAYKCPVCEFWHLTNVKVRVC